MIHVKMKNSAKNINDLVMTSAHHTNKHSMKLDRLACNDINSIHEHMEMTWEMIFVRIHARMSPSANHHAGTHGEVRAGVVHSATTKRPNLW